AKEARRSFRACTASCSHKRNSEHEGAGMVMGSSRSPLLIKRRDLPTLPLPCALFASPKPIKEKFGMTYGVGTFTLDVCLLIAGIALGSVGLVYVQRYAFGRVRTSRVMPGEARADAGSAVQGGAASAGPLSTQGELSSRQLSLLIATGIGLHN